MDSTDGDAIHLHGDEEIVEVIDLDDKEPDSGE